MGGDGLSLPSLADHEKLRQNGHRLQVDGEGPEDLQRREVMVDQESKATHRNDQELHSESVMVAIIGGFELGVDQVDSGVCTSDVNNLHSGVVQRDKRGEEVQVASRENQSKQNLTLARYTGTRPALPYLEQQDDDRR